MIDDFSNMRIAFIGSAGIPNRYGGFESFLEHCGPIFADATASTIVTCDASLYRDDLSPNFCGVRRVFLRIHANGISSIFHDLLAFFRIYYESTHIIVLGVSGGAWFPLFQVMCRLGGKRLAVNIDGVEWRRKKFRRDKQIILRLFDYLAQRFSDVIVYDNAGLASYLIPRAQSRVVEIRYSGDHVLRLPEIPSEHGTALTICRIEPENNIEMLIEGALNSNLVRYTIVGNWNSNDYGRTLRGRFSYHSRLELLDPVYDSRRLAELRESCAIYLHGHSVGGTNPSLVEMLFYDCQIICFDVNFNRATAESSATYFRDSRGLANNINTAIIGANDGQSLERRNLRRKYTGKSIADSYLRAICEAGK